MINFNIIKDYFGAFFNKGNERTLKAKKNIAASLILKGISIVIGLIYVPLLINYLGTEEYGVWLTLSSIIGWFSFFDIGLGNGLRNRLTEVIAKNDIKLAKEYVSTTYAILILVFGFVLLLFYCINPLLNWGHILNTSHVDVHKLSLLALVIFSFFILRFIFQLIGNIYSAHQLTAVNDSLNPIGNIISLAIILVLMKTTKGDLLVLGWVLSFVPVLVLLLFTFIGFSGRFKHLRPSLSFVHFKHTRILLSLGIKFFVFQIASLILFSTSNIIIAQVLSPNEVTQYNIAYKYFSISYMALSIMINPIWTAVTDAYVREDFDWLKNTLKKMNKIGIVFLVGLIIQLIISSWAYHLWVGNKVHIPTILSIALFFDFGWSSFSAVYSAFINGFGKLKLGMFTVWLRLLLFIPIAIFLTKEIGVAGIVWASVIGKFTTIIDVVQVYKLINRKAYGIWNK